MIKNLKNKKVVLGSASPRRKYLLSELLQFPFEIAVTDIEEVFPDHLMPEKVPEYLAEKKANFLLKKFSDHLIITADTVVILNNSIIGKPENSNEAIEMLFKLSGKKHTVVSGVCITHRNHSDIFSDFTDVYFQELNKEEIEYYINNFNPFDKAGAYGIQEWIGMIGIKRINGSYFNVMGLPVHQLYMKLKNIQ